MSEAEIEHQSKGLRHLIVPELTSIAEIDGQPVGAGFGLLDYNQIIKKIDGRLFPFGWYKLLTGKTGDRPSADYQHECACPSTRNGASGS